MEEVKMLKLGQRRANPKQNKNENKNHSAVKQDTFIKYKFYVYVLKEKIRQEKIIQLKESSKNYISTNHSTSGL